MSDSCNLNRLNAIVDFVNDAIVTNTDAIEICASNEFFHSFSRLSLLPPEHPRKWGLLAL